MFIRVAGFVSFRDLYNRLRAGRFGARIPAEAKDIYFFAKSSRPALDPPSLQLNRYRGELREYSDQGVKLTVHFLLV